MESADLAVLCLPDDAARESVALADSLGRRAPRLLDASTAHRTAPGWVYGFPELTPGQAQAIAASPRVANVGCYALGAIALLRPLIEAGLIPNDHPLSINGVSGYSGGGRQMIEAHAAEGGPAYELYALGLEHKHVPEIMAQARLTRRPVFVPSVGHFAQGMLVSVPLHFDLLPGRVTADAIHQAWTGHYAGAPTITVQPPHGSGRLTADALAGTDRLELFEFAHERHRHGLLVARLDNLGKGASGQAVQNIRLMLGLPDA
jgi:N-acetyl-gamma-glutamyl-phosphate reductase